MRQSRSTLGSGFMSEPQSRLADWATKTPRTESLQGSKAGSVGIDDVTEKEILWNIYRKSAETAAAVRTIEFIILAWAVISILGATILWVHQIGST
jgi:hypothetical protein